MEKNIKKAMDVFDIPPDHVDFLFLLPPFYVAKADGKVSAKEVMAIGWNSITSGLFSSRHSVKEALDKFLEVKAVQFQNKTDFSDFKLLAKAINARLERLPDDKSKTIRDIMLDMCLKVAEASGPIFGKNINDYERQMLKLIFDNM